MRDGLIDRRTDRQMEGQTDGVKPIYPPTIRCVYNKDVLAVQIVEFSQKLVLSSQRYFLYW